MLTTQLLHGDCLKVLPTLPEASVHCCVTSPPYWRLRDYGTGPDQLGLEPKPDCLGWATGEACEACYVCRLVAVFREVRRVLRDDGTVWLVLGDSFTAGNRKSHGTRVGYKQQTNPGMNGTNDPPRPPQPPGLRPKSLVGIPWRVALALQADGWILRSDIIWAKPNPMPESVRDRCTRSHEYVFMLAKNTRYYYDAEAIAEPAVHGERFHGAYVETVKHRAQRNGRGDAGNVTTSRNKRDVWPLATQPYKAAHFAVFPSALVEPMVLAATSERGVCPACGAPWARVVERGKSSWEARKAAGHPMRYGSDGNGQHQGRGAITAERPVEGGLGFVAPCITTGWQPTCPCDAGDPVAAAVLDPCGGAGTVALVAEQHGRHAVIIERNPDYIELSRARLGAVSEIPNRKATP